MASLSLDGQAALDNFRHESDEGRDSVLIRFTLVLCTKRFYIQINPLLHPVTPYKLLIHTLLPLLPAPTDTVREYSM